MRSARILGAAAITVVALAIFALATNLLPNSVAQVKIGASDIGGVVASSKGPEAGVWVIAETTDLPTRYIKEVVTDDQRPLPDSRFAQGEVHRVGARLRPGGFAEGRIGAWQASRFETGSCAGHEIRRAILSRQLLVRAAGGSRRK